MVYAVLAVCVGIVWRKQQDEKAQLYKVEINRILAEIRSQINVETEIEAEGKTEIKKIDLEEPDTKMTDVSKVIREIDLVDSYREIRSIAYLPTVETDKDVSAGRPDLFAIAPDSALSPNAGNDV